MAHPPRLALDSAAPGTVDGRHIRAVTFQAVRLRYVADTLAALTPPAPGIRTLVVGSGRGLLARGLAGLGLRVTAVDPSGAATALAREADRAAGADLAHATASPERLPFGDGEFDLVYGADTFEITPHLDRVVREAARVLAPGGLLLYDTVNRTWVSRLIYLGAFQRFPATRIMPPGRYAAERLRPPAELAEALGRHGLRGEDVCAFTPRSVRGLVTATLARRRGRITDEEIPPLVDMVLTPGGPPVVTYLGYARAVG